jgi:hypothetical protein
MVLNPDSGFPAQETQNFRLYRDDGTLFLSIDSSPGAGLRIWDPSVYASGDPAVVFGTTGLALMSRIPGHEIQSHPGGVFMDPYDGVGQGNIVGLRLATGYPTAVRDPLGSTEWRLWSPKDDLSQAPFISAEFKSLGAVPRPIIDLTNASAAAGKEARVVVNDIWYGTPSGNTGILPTQVSSYPRGVVAFAEQTNDVTLSTTAGTFTQVVETPAVNVVGGRRYKVTFTGGLDILTNGSGFTVSDTWDQKIQRSVNGGAYGDVGGATRIARAWVASGFRYNIPVCVRYYDPAISASVSWRLVASKVAGAATVNSIYETNAGASPFDLSVEDIGLAI